MERIDVGIIGGSGIGDRLLAFGGQPLHIPTEAGILRGRHIIFDGLSIFVCSRHSAGHKVPPHLVNYRAITLGMKQLEVKACFSTAAVGSLRPDWTPGTLIACSDFFELTGRAQTLFDATVTHRDFTDPFGKASRSAFLHAGEQLGVAIQPKGLYLTLNGPRYETPEEIRLYRQLGAEVVGMTAGTEAILMREAEIDYGCLAIVTNLASGISETPLSHDEVIDEMNRSGETAVKVLLAAARHVANS